MVLSCVKIKVRGYSLISNIFTITGRVHLSGRIQSCSDFGAFKRIVHIVISVVPDTHLHLSEGKHVRMNCLVLGHNI